MDVSVNIVEHLEAKVPNISLKSWLRPKNRAKRRRFARVREVWKSITARLKSHNHKSNITCVNISDHRTVYILSSSNNCRVLWIKLKCAWKNCSKWCVTIPHIHPCTEGHTRPRPDGLGQFWVSLVWFKGPLGKQTGFKIRPPTELILCLAGWTELKRAIVTQLL